MRYRQVTDSHPFASWYTDRHGRQRWRYRHGGINVSLPATPGDPEFEDAYQRACDGTLQPRLRNARRREAALDDICDALDRAKARASRAAVAFDLDRGGVRRILDRQGWRCAVSGIAFHAHRYIGEDIPFRPSLDRITPSLGYVESNVRIVCEIVNLAMNRWGSAPLLKLVSEMSRVGVANRSG
jgi:hypothetical protein